MEFQKHIPRSRLHGDAVGFSTEKDELVAGAYVSTVKDVPSQTD